MGNFIKQLCKENWILFSFNKNNNSGYFIIGTIPSENDDYYKIKYFYK